MPSLRLRIRDWRVDPAAGTLENGQGVRHLDPKTMAVLCYLASKPGEPVTKAELIDAVWNGGAVSDDALTGAVSALRKALGDSPRQPEYIRTLPRVGYTLITPVRRETGDYLKRDPPVRAPLFRVPFVKKASLQWTAVSLMLALVVMILAAARHRSSTVDEAQPWTSARTRIAVLPFADRSTLPSESYLADALPEAVITRLAAASDFHVLSWRTARQYDDRDLPLATLAEELDLDAVLEGSFRSDGQRLRLHARLIDARDDRHLWAETYDRPVADLLAIEDDLVRRASAAIQDPTRRPSVPASGAEASPWTKPPKVSSVAYQEFLKGRYFRHRESEQDLEGAVRHLRRAVDLEPTFAAAHAALAEVYFLQTEGKGLSRSEGLELGSRAAAEALRLDPELGAAHAADAIVKFCLGWDFAAAERSFQAFLERQPQDPFALEWYIRFLMVTGRFDEALEQWQRIAELDPASYTDLSPVRTLILARRYDEALARLTEVDALVPGQTETRRLRSLVYDLLGREEEAIADYLQLQADAGWPAERLSELKEIYRRQGAEGVFRRFETLTPAIFDKAAFRARVGDQVGALQLLEQAFVAHDRSLPWVHVHPWFDDLRAEPRFLALLARLQLP